jgi:hypothetical protein
MEKAFSSRMSVFDPKKNVNTKIRLAEKLLQVLQTAVSKSLKIMAQHCKYNQLRQVLTF